MSLLIDSYPYLFGCLVLLAMAAVAFWLLPGQRRALLVSGILATPFALLAAQLVPEYWQPVRVAVLLVGPEDLIFSFATGVLAWALAVFPVRHRLAIRLRLRSLLAPLAVCLLSGFLLHLACRLAGLRGVVSHVVPALVLGAVLLAIRPSLWPVPLAGALLFPVVYLAVPASIIRIQPEFLLQWNLANLSGRLLLGVPVEELWWALAFGVGWPLVLASALDGQLLPAASMAPADSAVAR